MSYSEYCSLWSENEVIRDHPYFISEATLSSFETEFANELEAKIALKQRIEVHMLQSNESFKKKTVGRMFSELGQSYVGKVMSFAEEKKKEVKFQIRYSSDGYEEWVNKTALFYMLQYNLK